MSVAWRLCTSAVQAQWLTERLWHLLGTGKHHQWPAGRLRRLHW